MPIYNVYFVCVNNVQEVNKQIYQAKADDSSALDYQITFS